MVILSEIVNIIFYLILFKIQNIFFCLRQFLILINYNELCHKKKKTEVFWFPCQCVSVQGYKGDASMVMGATGQGRAWWLAR